MNERQLTAYPHLTDPQHQTHLSDSYASSLNDGSQQSHAAEPSMTNAHQRPPRTNMSLLKQHHHWLPRKQHDAWKHKQHQQQQKWRDMESLKHDQQTVPQQRPPAGSGYSSNMLALRQDIDAQPARNTGTEPAAVFNGSLCFDQHSISKFGLTSGMSVVVMVEVCGVLQPNKYQRVLTWDKSGAEWKMTMPHVNVHVPEGPMSQLYMNGWKEGIQHTATTLGTRMSKTYTCVISRSAWRAPDVVVGQAKVC